MELVLFALIVSLVGILAARWGFDSTERLDSAEWDRRRSRPEGRGDGAGQHV